MNQNDRLTQIQERASSEVGYLDDDGDDVRFLLDALEACRAERERLREALKTIAGEREIRLTEQGMAKRARAALAATPTSPAPRRKPTAESVPRALGMPSPDEITVDNATEKTVTYHDRPGDNEPELQRAWDRLNEAGFVKPVSERPAGKEKENG